MKMKTGLYYYKIHGDHYRIYRCVHADAFSSLGEPVAGECHYLDREEARKRVYELNKWHFNSNNKKDGTSSQT